MVEETLRLAQDSTSRRIIPVPLLDEFQDASLIFHYTKTWTEHEKNLIPFRDETWHHS